MPSFVADSVISYFGERGRRWIAELPGVVAELCERWGLQVVGAALTGGTHSYVAFVYRADGSEAVLKIPVVDAENIAEATALSVYKGDGAVVLYEYDVTCGAMLLEAARPGAPLVPQGGSRHQEGLPNNTQAVRIACELYRRLARPSVDECVGFPAIPLVDDLVATWRRDLPHRARASPGPVATMLMDAADRHLAVVAVPDGPVGVVNRDTHLGNIVAAQREPWLLIDPKPMIGERAFDAGYLAAIQVESDPRPQWAESVVERTAMWLGVRPERVHAWAYLRALDNGWHFDRIGAESSSTVDLEVAQALAVL